MAPDQPAAAPAPSVAVLVVSGAVAGGRAQDSVGPLLRDLIEQAGMTSAGVDAVADDREAIEARLRAHVRDRVGVVLTAGGTGLTPDDVTPEATRAVLEREAPGFAEALRAESLRHTPMGLLTRGVAGTTAQTLIVNLPGSPRAVAQLFAVLSPVLAHAVETLRSPGGSRALHARAGDPPLHAPGHAPR